MNTDTRSEIPLSLLAKSQIIINDKLHKRLDKRGWNSYASNHEALGIITEEYFELIEAVKSNDNENVAQKLIDIAVGCIWAVAGMLMKGQVS